jgi:uncharacterized protein YjbI with pentapeptide repeats
MEIPEQPERQHIWRRTLRQLFIAVPAIAISVVIFKPLLWPGGVGIEQDRSVTTTSVEKDKQGNIIKSVETTTNDDGKTLWDWLSLLGVPLTLAGLGFWFQQIQQRRADEAAREQRELAADETKEEVLQVYFDRLSALLVDKNLLAIAARTNSTGTEESQLPTTATLEQKELLDSAVDVIRARTLSILRRFENDAERKTSVIRFLIEADIVSKLKLDLSEADLSGTNLSWAKLSGAKLNTANLKGTNLSWANLEEAQLHTANLNGADLSSAFVSKANLFGANLRGANLRGTKLDGAFVSEADLRDTNLSWAKLSGADLSGTDFSKANLSGANLSYANLYRAKLNRVDLGKANLSRADLSNAKLSKANLRGAKLSYADLSIANLSEADLSYTDLSNANLQCADLSHADLNEVNLSGANLCVANIEDIKWSQKTISLGKEGFAKANNIPDELKEYLGFQDKAP